MNIPTIHALTSEYRVVEFSTILQFLKEIGDYSDYFRDLLTDAIEREYGNYTSRVNKVPLCLVEGDSFISVVCQIVENENDTNPDSPLNLLVDTLEEVKEWGDFFINLSNNT